MYLQYTDIAIIVLRIKCQHMHKTNNEITKSSNYRDIFNLNYDRTERNAIQLDKEKLGPGTEAHFDISATKNVTALVGKSAQLNCRIKDLGNKTVRRLNISLNIYEISLVHIAKVVFNKKKPELQLKY